MRNAGTRRKEMHVSPQAQKGKQRVRVREAARGDSQGLPGVWERLRVGEGALGVMAGGGGLASSTGQGAGEWEGQAGGLGTHTAPRFHV